ncbi:capping protein inhibiting regulator of actin dynamics-like isoform X5 [Vespa crabro]|uniref:capping protein inhibiting regulator of actin dynamics-like isoform X5 n=1 Tax=Vespa crabro TaxID=7445 RepID=UPI001F02E677|nr:capping protein inhibiting regulator of actin dynamics-like isoform X5 [Vespa crabro]
MFSELCRETLRKAAVCYSSGRAGSPSPSPPTSPPASPAKEAKTSANTDLGNVRGTGCECRESSATGRRHTTQPVELRDFREKRPAMPTDFNKRLPGLEARDAGRRQLEECRFTGGGGSGGGGGGGSGGWDGGGVGGGGEIGEYGRPGSRLGRQSGLSSPEPESEFDTSEDNSSTSGDEAGAASEEINQRTSSAHNRHSLTKEETMHWFAQIGGDGGTHDFPDNHRNDVKRRRSLYDEDSLDDDRPDENEARDSTGSAKDVDRARLVRERQNEERQRKLEELRQHALAAQRFREQREEERRRRIDELRSRDNDRRNQVEERKRLICEAERERREAILRKNQEREARIEAKKKNERSHIVFAFGSSTPRMLEPADTGGSTFWGTRRATSTTNVMMFSAAQPLTRRSSERELDGSKKRATSAGGLDRKPGEDMRMSSSMYEVFNWNSSPDPPLTPGKHKRASLSLPPTTDIFAIDDKSDSDTRRPMIQRAVSGEDSDGTPGTPSSVYLRVNRRRTDLMPTIPSPRDGPPTSGRSSSAKAFARSPGRTYSMSRLDQLSQPRKRPTELSTLTEQQSQPLSGSSMSRSMSHLAAASGSKSLKRSDNSRSMGTLPGAVPMPRPTRAERLRRKARELHSQQQQDFSGDAKLTKDSKPPLPKVHSTPKKPSTPKASEIKKPTEKLIKNAKASPRITPKATPLQSPGVEHSPLIREATEIIGHDNDNKNGKSEERNEEKKDHGSEKAQDVVETELVDNEEKNEFKNDIKNEVKNDGPIVEQPVPVAAIKQAKDDSNFMQETLSSQESSLKKDDNNKVEKVEKKLAMEQEGDTEVDNEEQIDMSASMIAKIRITTEEEAKAALAERRRLAREQAEREAELERLRLEEEARLEAEKLRAEEEEQRRLEEETLRLANEARQAEEQRLKLAIEEAKRREEEDRRRREEEARQKQEKEEAEKKAREEVERQRIEMAERLKKEEEERIARRKRVEAIMLRTRGKNQSNTPTKGEGGDGDKLKEDSPSDENKSAPGSKNEDVMTASLISEATQQFISSEQRAHHVENVTAPTIVHNGTHSNGINENKIVLDNNQGNVEGGLNGHHTNHGNEINSQSITLDNATVKQNNVTNSLLDLSEFDTLSNNSSGPTLELTLNMAKEDTLNSNLNPAAIPFTPMANTFTSAGANANINPFQDAYVNNKQQESNQMSDLLS